MNQYKAVIFDLDDTLVDRNEAVSNLFYIILEKYYKNTDKDKVDVMLEKFRSFDKMNYGEANKVKVLKPFFEEFSSEVVMAENSMIEFWNENLPKCFTPDKKVLNLLDEINRSMKTAIITNGTTQRQKEKIKNSGLDQYFETILISEEVGYRKPQKIIFDMAVEELNVRSEEVLFIGDNLVWDVMGSQEAGMNGVWYNPSGISNDTDMIPDYEIRTLEGIFDLMN